MLLGSGRMLRLCFCHLLAAAPGLFLQIGCPVAIRFVKGTQTRGVDNFTKGRVLDKLQRGECSKRFLTQAVKIDDEIGNSLLLRK